MKRVWGYKWTELFKNRLASAQEKTWLYFVYLANEPSSRLNYTKQAKRQ